MNDGRMIGTDLLKEFEHAVIQYQLLSGTPVNNVSDYKQCPLKRENGSQVSLALVYLKTYCKVKSSQKYTAKPQKSRTFPIKTSSKSKLRSLLVKEEKT